MRTSSDTPGTFGLVIELHRSTLSDWLNDESYGVARVGTGKLRHWQVSTDNECVSIFSRSEPIIGELRE